jgi:hypothetical protein
VGVCSGGACYSKPNLPCTYPYDGGFCSDDLLLPGMCNSAGKCTPVQGSIPGKVTCTTPCKSVCVVCKVGPLPLQLCLDGVFGF